MWGEGGEFLLQSVNVSVRNELSGWLFRNFVELQQRNAFIIIIITINVNLETRVNLRVAYFDLMIAGGANYKFCFTQSEAKYQVLSINI